MRAYVAQLHLEIESNQNPPILTTSNDYKTAPVPKN